MHSTSHGGCGGKHQWRVHRWQKVRVTRTTQNATPTPIFFFFKTKNTAAKRDLGVANQGEIHMCINNSQTLPLCPLAALRQSLIPLFSGLRGFPLLTATWMDGLDGLSIVCPSPRYRNFRPDRIGILLGGIGTFLSSFRQDWLSIGLSDFPHRFPLGYIHSQVRV